MAFPTKPAFIHYGDFDSKTLAHPALKWMEGYRDDFDQHTFDPKWYANDTVYIAADGQRFEGRDRVMEAVKNLYGPLTAHSHQPFLLNCTETQDGYELIGLATVYANLPGEPAAGETKKKDKHGKHWDVGGPGCFRFNLVKHGDGFLLTNTEIYADGGAILMGMLKRGVVSMKDLGM